MRRTGQGTRKRNERKRPEHLKGQCHEIFDFRLFYEISFPQAPEYHMRAVSNFFENSQKYSEFKVHHRRQICRRCRLLLGVLLDLRISLRIFEKILNDPNVIFRGLGEDEP